jgi:hypothetical protein
MKRRRQQSALWIKETQNDDPIDLTEPTAARSIYGMFKLKIFLKSNLILFSNKTINNTRN